MHPTGKSYAHLALLDRWEGADRWVIFARHGEPQQLPRVLHRATRSNLVVRAFIQRPAAASRMHERNRKRLGARAGPDRQPPRVRPAAVPKISSWSRSPRRFAPRTSRKRCVAASAYSGRTMRRKVSLRCLPCAHSVPATCALVWHFIGPIQSNKTRLDRRAFRLGAERGSLKCCADGCRSNACAHLPDLQLCIQVNISGEDSKHGVAPAAVAELARAGALTAARAPARADGDSRA